MKMGDDEGFDLFCDESEPEPEPEPEPEMPVAKKAKIEPEYEYKVLFHIAEDDLITPPHHPPFKMRSLIHAAYANDKDLSRICEMSSSGSPNGDGESKEEWRWQFLTEDGHLRFDEIVGLLPPPPQMTTRFLSSYNAVLNCAQMGVASYNRRKGTEYELVAPVICSLVFHAHYFMVYHSNFFAKLKHTNSPVELFFAEMVACKALPPGQDKVVKCSILTPQNCGRSSRGCSTTDPLSVLHPEEIDCPSCIQRLAYEGESEGESD